MLPTRPTNEMGHTASLNRVSTERIPNQGQIPAKRIFCFKSLTKVGANVLKVPFRTFLFGLIPHQTLSCEEKGQIEDDFPIVATNVRFDHTRKNVVCFGVDGRDQRLCRD